MMADNPGRWVRRKEKRTDLLLLDKGPSKEEEEEEQLDLLLCSAGYGIALFILENV